jgi:hypothetical protein
MTLADVVLVSHLVKPFEMFIDATYRKASIPNLTRYISIILSHPLFKEVFGNVEFVKKFVEP